MLNGAAFYQARPGPAPPSNTHPLYVDVGMSHQYGLQPIPTPPPSAHGMPSRAHTPAGSNAFSPSALARPSHRHSLPNISDYALNSTPIGELGRRPAPPTSLHQNGVRPMAIQHAQQQQPPRQQQRQQQHAQHQIFVQHPHQQQPPHRPSAAPLDHVRSASYPHSRPTTSQSQIQPQSQPPPQPQPPLASFDPAQTTQLLLQPAKALFEQTWATTVGAVQHELGMYARAHDAVLEQNRVIEQDYRSLYQAYVKTDAERMRLAGELEVARVALGKEDQATREMQLRNGQIALQSQKMREAYSRAASDMEITAKAVQRCLDTCKCGAAPSAFSQRPVSLNPPTSAPMAFAPAHPPPKTEFIDLTMQMDTPPAEAPTPGDLRREREDGGERDEHPSKRIKLAEDELQRPFVFHPEPPPTFPPDRPHGQRADGAMTLFNGGPVAQPKFEPDTEASHLPTPASDPQPSPTLSTNPPPSAPELDDADADMQAVPPAPPRQRARIGVNHLELAYAREDGQMVCRMCKLRQQEDTETQVTAFAANAPGEVLIGHCEECHPAACASLVSMSPSQIVEMKQRIAASS